MEGNKAVLKTFKILEVIAKHTEGVTLTQIVKETHLPKSTVFDILEALYQEDAVFYKDYYRKTYVIGGKLFGIGQSYINHSNFINIGSPLVDDFSNKYNVLCYLCKKADNRMVYVYSHSPEGCKLKDHAVGSNFPLNTSLSGKAYLAYVKGEEKDLITESIGKEEIDRLEPQLNKIRQIGYACGVDKDFPAIHKCAVPVFNFERRVTGVISFYQLRSDDIPQKQIDEFIEIANIISTKQGYIKEN